MAMTNDQLEQYFMLMLKKLFPTIIERLNKQEETIKFLLTRIDELSHKAPELPPLVGEPAPEKKEKRRRITYDDYQKVDALAASGLGDKDIAKELDMPYSTVRKILRFTDADIEKLRKKAGIQNPDVTMVDPAENGWRVVETEPADDKFAARAGWRGWSMRQKEVADQSNRPSDAFPLEAPCPPYALVDVIYMNEYVSKGIRACDADWGTAGGIKWFRLLEPKESE